MFLKDPPLQTTLGALEMMHTGSSDVRLQVQAIYVLCYIPSGSQSDGSCVFGRIHSDVSPNIYQKKKVYHIVTDNFVNL